MPPRPRKAILIALALLSAAALAANCSKKGGTSPPPPVTGPTFDFSFPGAAGPSGGGTSVQFTFTDVGTWDYHCTTHASLGMTGSVTVSTSAPSNSAFVQVGTGTPTAPTFTPSAVSITPGGHVRWQNVSASTFHTVTRR